MEADEETMVWRDGGLNGEQYATVTRSQWERHGSALFEDALRSIAANSCCEKCQEAALVAKRALEQSF